MDTFWQEDDCYERSLIKEWGTNGRDALDRDLHSTVESPGDIPSQTHGPGRLNTGRSGGSRKERRRG